MVFLNGNFREVLQDLSDKMNRAAEELKYEEAAEYRDLMDSVRRIGEHQKITSGDGEDKDVGGFWPWTGRTRWLRCFLSGTAS